VREERLEVEVAILAVLPGRVWGGANFQTRTKKRSSSLLHILEVLEKYNYKHVKLAIV
jgi:hypothetical protein